MRSWKSGRYSSLMTSGQSIRRSCGSRRTASAHSPPATSTSRQLRFELSTTLQQAWITEPLGHRGESRGRASPPDLVNVTEERRVSAERCQRLEQKRQLALVAQHGLREIFDLSVELKKPGSCGLADAGNAWVSVGCIAHEREEVGDQGRLDAELRADFSGVPDVARFTIHLDYPVVHDALRKVLVGSPDGNFLDIGVGRGD